MSDWPGSASVPPGDERPVAEPDVGGDDTAPAGRQRELDLGLVPTGDPRVAAALAPLDRLAGHPVDEQLRETVDRVVRSGVLQYTTGLPDDWELLLFGTSTNEPGGDVDQDGFPNGDEFVAFTDPTNSASYFRATGVTNAGGAYVVVPSVTGRQYRLYGSELLGGQSWTNLVAGPVAGTGGNISLSAGTSQTSAAVRLEVDLP